MTRRVENCRPGDYLNQDTGITLRILISWFSGLWGYLESIDDFEWKISELPSVHNTNTVDGNNQCTLFRAAWDSKHGGIVKNHRKSKILNGHEEVE